MTDESIRILLIEDNPGDKALVSALLHQGELPHELTWVDSLGAATQWIEEGGRPDVALLDMRLPDGAGVAALERMTRVMPNTPIVVLTGMADASLSRACLEAGASDYLSKDELHGRALTRSIHYAVLRRRAGLLRTQLEHADRLVSIGEIAAGVAHEINNPAAFVLANVSELMLLLDSDQPRPASGGNARVLLRDIRDGVERIVRVSADLLEFAQNTDEGYGEIIDANELCRRSIGLVMNRLRHCAEIETDFQATQSVSGDPIRFGQVLVNLLVNAANAIDDAGPGDHKVTIATSDLPEAVEISVTDTGAGIPIQAQSRLFEPFFTTRAERGGTGLGLSICREIVVRSGGVMEFDSTPGVGTVFRVRFPRCNARPAPVQAPAAPSRVAHEVGVSGLRVLLIDDEAQLRRALSMVIGRRHEVHDVGTATEALELLASGERFDAIVCDLMMPRMDGVEFLRALSEDQPQLRERTGILTGGATTPEAQAYLEGGNVPTLSKPATSQQLHRFIDGLAAVGADTTPVSLSERAARGGSQAELEGGPKLALGRG